ncbi:hypothetical protein TanjilG_24777 [Lupinus angustifolius]|uniref:F-box domain-containing protein n=1 Tax=Lupinus angustifolius TaxID=3871 RepID=A0A4P1RL61_LUPAN|nr:hypothetical protein TanjilG_24777 [Lupinus angustifolius]
MKLRLRSLESKETLKLDVPNSCSLQHLKETISHSISSSSSSPSSPSSFHLSLNRNDELHASSPNDSLNSIGITNGDLIFYTLNTNAFSPETLIHKPVDITMSDAPSIPEPEKSQTLDAAEAETTDLVYGSVEAVTVGKSNSQPSFLKRVLIESLGNDVNDFKLLVFAVHAVFLESGFVLADKAFNIRPSVLGSTMSFRYSLPEILNNCSDIKAVILKFPTLGHLVNVYGSLSDVPGSGLPEVCLDKCKYARPLENMLKNSESKDDKCEKEIFELWKMVKDRLALPLLIDLCDKAGLDPPPCFMRLPSELKLKILEYVPGVDLAKVACVSRELQYLSSTNHLWKLKIEEEFGQIGSGGNFSKDMFVLHWDSKKKSEQVPFRTHLPRPVRFFPGGYPTPFGVLPIVGGDYDWLPGLGLSLPSYPPRRTFLPPCHRGGFDN